MSSNRNLKYTDALSLSGPRTYFTLLDKNNLQACSNKNQYLGEIEEALKVLLLTKDNIVIAASHLASSEALQFFEDKARLFEDGIILPALRSEFNTFEEMYNEKYGDSNKEIPHFFEGAIKEVIPWDLQENSGWFYDRIKEEVQNNKSVLRKNLRVKNCETPFLQIIEKQVKSTEEGEKFFSREALTKEIDSTFSGDIAIGINQWVDLLYYISGSRVVNCENLVPQENLVSFNLAKMSHGNHILSESEIFHSIVIMLVLNSFYSHAYPVNIIKNLTINDILQLRNNNAERSSEFRKKYEKCLTACEKGRAVKDKDLLIRSLSELRSLADNARSSFTENFDKELASYQALVGKKHKTNKIIDLFINFIGIFLLPVSVINFIFNNCQLKDIGSFAEYRKRYSVHYYNAIRSYIKKQYKNDPILLEYIDDIIRIHKENYLVRK